MRRKRSVERLGGHLVVCLDATFVIDILRGNKNISVLLEEWKTTEERVTIPAPAVTEVISGAMLEASGKERALLDKLLSSLFVLPLTRLSCVHAGELDAELVKAGQQIGLVDLMIASIAIENSETLITRNLRHFQRIPGLVVTDY
jgi:tRNA(fMet)-specific endonuclease VapC